MEKNDLSAHRAPKSMQAVLSDGYRLYARNFGRLVRSSWIQALAYALALGFSQSYFFTFGMPAFLQGAGESQLARVALLWLGTGALFLAAIVLFAFAGGVAPLRDHHHTGAIHAPRHWWGRWPWRLTLKGFVALPRMLWQTIRRGQLGMLILVSLVMLLVVLVAEAILLLPADILMVANVQAQKGLAAGDAVDLPQNIFWINMGTFSLCALLQAYIHLSTLFPLYYVWKGRKAE